MPLQYLLRLVSGLFTLALLAASIYGFREWWEVRNLVNATEGGEDRRDWLWLALAVLPLLFTFFGRSLILPFLGRKGHDPSPARSSNPQTVVTPSGASVHVDTFGPADAPPLVMIHGWGLDSTIWRYLRAKLGDRYRVLAPDLPGLSKSKGPQDGVYTLERFADVLASVLQLTGGRPAVVMGHSIGGMTIQTFARRFPEALGPQVAGIVLVNTTYTNPVRTTAVSWLVSALRWPVIEPGCRLLIWLKPLGQLMNWLGYLNGSNHLVTRISSFGSEVTREQVEHATRLTSFNSVAVQAKGMLAMMRWDASEVAAKVPVPMLVVGGKIDILTKLEANGRSRTTRRRDSSRPSPTPATAA
jgi:pimeloyl-ACP methyl ester carboxylesterase